MKILLTGATGYIGKRLLPVLVEAKHEVICLVRDADRFSPPKSLLHAIKVVEGDLLKPETLEHLPHSIDAAYYLVHSMSASKEYPELEEQSARNFKNAMNQRSVEQVIYLSGIVNDETLSRHLLSRLKVEKVLKEGNYALTTLRAGIIIGSGSASFEIIRDLVEKLPVMIAPKWLETKCQPIGIRDVISFLTKVLSNEKCYHKNFDIGGPDILTYREMLLQYAKVRQLKRYIFVVPVMTPRLSSYWLYFVTSTSIKLAMALVDSMKVEVVCRDQRINDIVGVQPLPYHQALQRTMRKIDENIIISSWKDSQVSSNFDFRISDFVNVPTHGCFKDERKAKVDDPEKCLQRLWSIGGDTGWYAANWLWKLRGFLDQLVGGVGLRRGRTHPDKINTGDAVDFWRVLYASKKEGRLLLFAEMKLPGEAWLDFSLEDGVLIQTATFRPWGLWGRLYWFLVLPFHELIFDGMLKKITS
ncbi:MAG TPA: SDR family oxidoreductase [Saprospiraceae bacterium]|nr:SDR family oxidoreductase [Saprospiraceae bacterium]